MNNEEKLTLQLIAICALFLLGFIALAIFFHYAYVVDKQRDFNEKERHENEKSDERIFKERTALWIEEGAHN